MEANLATKAFLEIYYQPEYENEDNPNKFSWNVTHLSNDTIFVKLNFTKPELVSTG